MRTTKRTGAAVHMCEQISRRCDQERLLKKKNRLNFTKTPNEDISSTRLNRVLPPTDTLHAYQMTQKPQLEPGEHCVLTLSNTIVIKTCDDARFLSVKTDICVSNQCGGLFMIKKIKKKLCC